MSSTLCSSIGGREKHTIDFEETELRLGFGLLEKLSCGNNGKRVFSESVDLKLNLSSSSSENEPTAGKEKMGEKKGGGRDLIIQFVHDLIYPEEKLSFSDTISGFLVLCRRDKGKVVGWPPIRSFRKNIMSFQPNKFEKNTAALVKVSMDGAPYLRKVDLKLYTSYNGLSDALSKMFSSFTMGNYGCDGLKDMMNEGKAIDLLNGSDYSPTYEDKDGDWMLVGDVPWDMFVDSCKRLRIMKGSESKHHFSQSDHI